MKPARLVLVAFVLLVLPACGGDDNACTGSLCGDAGANQVDSGTTADDGGLQDADTADGPRMFFGATPVLHNFRVESGEPNRVYFDSSLPITGSTAAGFTISESTLLGVTVNGNSLTGHYFATGTSFTYWSNNTIRYEGGSDLAGLDNRPLLDFTLTYIFNNIPQPESSGTPYYVRTAAKGGDDSNDGLSPQTAFASLSKAVAVTARVIYVEVGSYHDEEVDLGYTGTPTDPILIQGYKTLTNGKPDPITPNYWVYGAHGTYDDKTVDDTELPTLVGSDAMRNSAGRALRIDDNTIVRNLQVFNYNTAISGSANNNVVVDNFVAVEIGGGFGTSGAWKALIFTGDHIKLKNITMSEGSGAFARIYGSYCLWDTVNYVGDQNHPDYQISLYSGSHNIVRNSTVNIVAGSAQHAFGIKASGVPSEYNLFDGNTSKSTGEGQAGMEWRHQDVKYTVTKNHTFDGSRHSIVPRDGTSYNIAENCIIKNGQGNAINFYDQVGEEGIQSAGDHNIFRNIVIYDTPQMVYGGAVGSPQPGNNHFINMTVHNVPRLFSNPNSFLSSNTFTNCTFSSSQDFSSSGPAPEPTFTNCNWFDNAFSAPSGTSNTTHDPMFVDPGAGNFRLQMGSPLADLGVDSSKVSYDFDGREREAGEYSIGAFENESHSNNR